MFVLQRTGSIAWVELGESLANSDRQCPRNMCVGVGGGGHGACA